MALDSRLVGPRGPTGPWSRGYELKIIFSKLHELQTTLNEKAQNNRRLEAQRNDLNGKVRIMRPLDGTSRPETALVRVIGGWLINLNFNPNGKF